MKLLLQSQATECGIACLGMAASAFGSRFDLPELRRRFPVSIKGLNLQQLISYASGLGLSARALRLELEDLASLRIPAILHWDSNHFVVLSKVTRKHVVVLDPAAGERRLTLPQVSAHFSGVALELTPADGFVAEDAAPRVRLGQLTGTIRGLGQALTKILLVAAVLEAFAIASPFFNQIIVDDAIASRDIDLLFVLTIGFSLLLITQTALSAARSWMVLTLSQTISLQWFGNVFSHLIKLPIPYFESRHLGDITSRFSSISAIQKALTTSVLEAILDGIMAIAAVIMMLIYSPGLTAIVAMSVLIYGLIRLASYGTLRDASSERLIVSAKENSYFLETLRAIVPLRLFGREEERRAVWQNLMVDVQNRDVRTAKLEIYYGSANSLIFGIENLLIFWAGAKLIINSQAPSAPQFTIGMLLAFVSYKMQFTGRISQLINYGINLRMLSLHAERLGDIVLTKREVDSLPSNDLDHLSPSLEMRGVSFRYGEHDPWILRDADLFIAAGQSVALTGPSGCGKTTLMKILVGLLEPLEGEILYGGIPVKQLGVKNVRRRIATVMQDDVLMTGSLADNITFFDVQPDESRMIVCATLAQIYPDIRRMPMGFHTLVGELGAGLSGGQKQRLLMARALYKMPSVLALDEPTSHLDVRNESAVTDALTEMRLTRLFIAHRPEMISRSERVVEILNMKLVERSLGPSTQKEMQDVGTACEAV